MIAAIAARLVEFARRNAAAVAIAALLLSLMGGAYTVTHLGINTDIERMLPTDVGWRRDELALDRAFPENIDLLVIVIDGDTADIADRAAGALAARMQAEPQVFHYLRRPDGGAFFDRNGLLFLPTRELEAMSDKLISAQPLIGSLAGDPSLRGLFDTLTLFLSNIGHDKTALDRLRPTLAAIAKSVDAALEGRSEPFSWQRMMTGRTPKPRERRRFVLARPVLDFATLERGGKPLDEVRRLARDLQLDPAHGVRMRLTGSVALNDEQFATLREGALRSTLTSIILVCTILFVAMRSVKLVGAILATLAIGLVLTASFAALAVGSLNPISVAFGVLFTGLAVDFSIQFSVRYRDRRHQLGTLPAALSGAGESLGPALMLAAGATAIGFFAFVPTQYTGIRELGWIAGFGMVIGLALNLLLLPALLALLRPKGEKEPIGFHRAALLDRLLVERRFWVIGAAAALAVAGLALLPRVSFDFDPLDLKDPHSESVMTARDLMQDPTTTPYTAEILAPSLPAAEALADRLGKLPEVAHAVTAASFIPHDQQKKLAVISDLALLLGPTLTPVAVKPPPEDAAVLHAMAACRDALRPLAAGNDLAARNDNDSKGVMARLAAALDRAVARGPAIVPTLQTALLTGLQQRLDSLAAVLQAKPVTLDSLPPMLRDSWLAPDGQARIEVFPNGNARDPAVLERFVAAVRSVAPDATGTPVTIQEAGHLISSAFIEAGIIAVAAISLLLVVVLRRLRDVLLVIAPLLLAAILTLAVTVVIGMKLNYANIIALPLLLGIGVAFDIYFVMNWRAGQDRHLQSSTARAVIFSALTTMSAFGSLALSRDPGSAEMGELLSISLACTLFSTLLVLPALLGPAPATAGRRRANERPAADIGQPAEVPQSSSPGLTRGSSAGSQDGRVKPGHDGQEASGRRSRRG